jgi:hypothetical protein
MTIGAAVPSWTLLICSRELFGGDLLGEQQTRRFATEAGVALSLLQSPWGWAEVGEDQRSWRSQGYARFMLRCDRKRIDIATSATIVRRVVRPTQSILYHSTISSFSTGCLLLLGVPAVRSRLPWTEGLRLQLSPHAFPPV